MDWNFQHPWHWVSYDLSGLWTIENPHRGPKFDLYFVSAHSKIGGRKKIGSYSSLEEAKQRARPKYRSSKKAHRTNRKARRR